MTRSSDIEYIEANQRRRNYNRDDRAGAEFCPGCQADDI